MMELDGVWGGFDFLECRVAWSSTMQLANGSGNFLETLLRVVILNRVQGLFCYRDTLLRTIKRLYARYIFKCLMVCDYFTKWDF